MKTKNVRTTLAALLSAALLSAPTTLWGQASQHGVRVVSQNDVKKVNATDITADGELVGASDNSTVTVTAADKTTETTPKVARVTVRKVTDVAANTVTISGSNAVSYGASTTLTLTVDPTYADGEVSWRYEAQSDNSSNGKVEFSSQTAVSASNGQATVSVKGTGAGKVNVYAKVGNVESEAYTVTINKAAASLTCNIDALSFAASNKKDATVTKTGVSASGGSVSVSSNNTAYCTVNYDNGTITVKRVSEAAWTATITVSVSADDNHTWDESNKKTFTVSAVGCFRLLSQATTSDHGKVVCAAGHLHTAKTAVPSGCTAVGILGKVTSGGGHGLILALQDATKQTGNTINGWKSEDTNVSNPVKVLPDNTARGSLTSYKMLGSTYVSNWAVAHRSDYVEIFENLGSTTDETHNGKTYDNNVNAYITTGVGGTALSGNYWSATEHGSDEAWWFCDRYWYSQAKGNTLNVRPVLAF